MFFWLLGIIPLGFRRLWTALSLACRLYAMLSLPLSYPSNVLGADIHFHVYIFFSNFVKIILFTFYLCVSI